jgi:acyl-CoA synthetase (AMP-forming)/AMP-acid ligase II
VVPIDHFDVAAERYPTHPGLIDGATTLTYAEIASMSHTIAGAVSSLADGDEPVPAVVYAANDYRTMLAMIGTMRAGGVIVPLHVANDVDSSVDFLSQVRPRCLFYHRRLARSVAQIRSAIPSIRRVVCLDGDDGDSDSLSALMREPRQSVRPWIDVSGNRSRAMYYWATSGSTGRPKVVVEDCGGFDAMLKVARGRRDRSIPIGVTMSLSPMTHGGGPSAFATLVFGGTVLVARAFDPYDVLQAIERHRVTELWLAPAALGLLIEHPEASSFDLSTLRLVTLGAAGVPVSTLRKAVEILGPCIVHSYGQIEASFITLFDKETLAAAARGDLPEHLLHSSGRTLGVNRVAVMDANAQLLPQGFEGEIVVRGACVKRYLDPTATEEARRGGWHHTGDVGYVDADGFLFVTGRLRDVVNVAGFKVAAAQIEGVVQELAAVSDCAVVAIPDAARGEIIKAVVTIKAGHTASVAAILSHCRSRLGPLKTPQIIEQWDELPRLPAGKIDKAAIRAASQPRRES